MEIKTKTNVTDNVCQVVHEYGSMVELQAEITLNMQLG